MVGAAAGSVEKQELQRLNELKTAFLNMAAHELNTPITPIRLQLQLLESGALGPLQESQARAIHIVERNMARLADLVQEILDVARMEGGGMKLHLEDVPLDQLVAETWDAFEEPARRVGIRLLRPAATNAVVHTDRRRALQIMYNIMSNAIKFTPSDGEIRMTVNRNKAGMAEVCVIDSGAGMERDQLEHLFKPFTRLHDDLATRGTGLGLYISHGLARSLGGDLSATSPGAGKGSTFCVTFPLAERVAANVPAPRPADNEELALRLRQLI